MKPWKHKPMEGNNALRTIRTLELLSEYIEALSTELLEKKKSARPVGPKSKPKETTEE